MVKRRGRVDEEDAADGTVLLCEDVRDVEGYNTAEGPACGALALTVCAYQIRKGVQTS